MSNAKMYELSYPVRHGQIDNWTHMEQFWEQTIFKYLRADPEDHYFLLVCFLRSPRGRLHPLLVLTQSHFCIPIALLNCSLASSSYCTQ